MKKRILALVLSTVMLLGETLPVMAQNDTDIVVEEETDEAVIETEDAADAEEAAEEIVFDTDVVVEDVPAAEEAEDAVVAAEEAAPAASVIDAELIEATEPDADGNSIARFALTADESEVVEAAVANAGAVGRSTSIDGGSVVIDGTTYMLNATMEYLDSVNYRGRKIKPLEDLGAHITNSSLYEAAKQISGVAVPYDFFTWKISANNKKNAGSVTYMTVKVSVSKSMAKAYGIKGKPLKKIKKAVKAFNKAAKKNKVAFEITPIDVASLLPYNIEIYSYYSGWIVLSLKSWYLRAKIDPLKPNKWKKLSKKEFIITKKKEGGKLYLTFQPKNKNFTGMTLNAALPLTR